MNYDHIEFCPSVKISGNRQLTTDAICKLVSEDVFGAGEEFCELLKKRYCQMQDNWRDVEYDAKDEKGKYKWNLEWNKGECEVVLNGCKAAALKVLPAQIWRSTCSDVAQLCLEPNFGHDLPVWMCRDNAQIGKRVMVIAQDPLRSDMDAGAMYLGSPFGLHCKSYREDWHVSNFMDILWGLLEGGVVVYATDYMKWFANKPGWVVSHLNRAKECSVWILQKEIDAFQPDLIVTFGRQASGCINSRLKRDFGDKMSTRSYDGKGIWLANDRNIRTLAFLHPAGTNANAIQAAIGFGDGAMSEYVAFVKKTILSELKVVSQTTKIGGFDAV